MRVLFALPGLHLYDRGAEVAFISVANELAKAGDQVTLIGSGAERPGTAYRFIHAASVPRQSFESFPTFPVLRSQYAYEEMTFVPGLLRHYRPADCDVTLTCNYPFCNWTLRRPVAVGSRPPHVFVTQNGDWPAQSNGAEFRFFACEGLVCTNPDYYERNQDRWRCALIPNGVDCNRFSPGAAVRQEFGLPRDRPVVLMVSALIPYKRVELGVKAVNLVPDAHLVVAGDGPMRDLIETAAAVLLPGRFTRLTIAPEKMPLLYRSADVLLHLAVEEPFGNVFVEAMACGIPIVAPDSPRLRYIVGDEEFLLVEDDPQAIARHIIAAQDAGPGQSKKRAERATSFSWSSVGARYRQFLHEVAGA